MTEQETISYYKSELHLLELKYKEQEKKINTARREIKHILDTLGVLEINCPLEVKKCLESLQTRLK